jgi:hypothetical protein
MRQNGKFDKTVPIRAHHLLCLQGFQGYGYSQKFLDHLSEIVDKITNNSQLFLEITNYPDVICDQCPNLSDFQCNLPVGEKVIREMDKLVIKKLGIFKGYIGESKTILEKTYTLEENDAKIICRNCGWQKNCTWYKKKARF